MISQTAAYALRAVVFLAKGGGRPMTRQQIADGGQVPLDDRTKVMQVLSEQGIVSVKRGPGGGYLIVGEKERLTVLNVVGAVEVSFRVKRCPWARGPVHVPCEAGRSGCPGRLSFPGNAHCRFGKFNGSRQW